MIQSTNKYQIQDILKKKAEFYYLIPKYQREYTWGYNEWDALYDDICENSDGYFIGSIICINESGDTLSPRFELVDGQQRLTTLSLLLLSIYHMLKAREDFISEDDHDELTSLKKQLANQKSPNGLILVPQVQNNNADDFKAIMSENNIIGYAQSKPYAKVRKIYRCFNHFVDRLAKDVEEVDNEAAVTILLEILRKVNAAMLVKIEVSSHSDAFVLFESLNNRGMPLTAIDLMKNLIMARAEKAGLTTDECYDQWKDLLTMLSDDYKVQERFFRHYYNAFKLELNEPFIKEEDRKKMPLGVVATRSNLLGIYEKLINRNLPAFLEEINRCGAIYSQICFPYGESCTKVLKQDLTNLYRIQGAPSYLLLLYLIRKKEYLQITEEQIRLVVQWLVIFFVRRNLTDLPSTRDLARIFMAIIEEIETKNAKGQDLLSIIHSTMKERCAGDEIFKSKLEGDIYKANVEATRYILCDLAQRSMTKETWTDLWKRDDSYKYIWTIEHIFPEGDRIPKPWIDMIAGGDHALAYEYKDQYVHKLGNLTMTGYNSMLSNYDFIKKRDRKNADNSAFVGYKNGLEINSEIAEKECWTVEDIKTRTKALVTKFCKIYKFPESI